MLQGIRTFIIKAQTKRIMTEVLVQESLHIVHVVVERELNAIVENSKCIM